MFTTQDMLNYERIEAAIDFVKTHYQRQPSLATIAEHVHVSPDHFQRLFQDWAGTSPKKFLQYIDLYHAKHLLADKQLSLFDATHELGLSSTSRLHDMFVQIEGMTPAEYKNGGRNLLISYAHYPTLFGELLVASTEKGICYVAFEEKKREALAALQKMYPEANCVEAEHALHQPVLAFFAKDWQELSTVKLHLRGTDFQLKVWEALLKIPAGKLSTYQHIAQQINHDKSSRAVGNAIGRNPVAFLIPCHRVIQSSGLLGGYRWGVNRKSALIGWEGAHEENLRTNS